MAKKKTIEIKCKGADQVPFEALSDFQGQLKKISKENLQKLKNQIIHKGFCAPIFVWKNGDKLISLDGHQRSRAINELLQEGYEIPLIPIDYIEADNEHDAREKLLSISSQYGEFVVDELAGWLEDLDKSVMDTIRLVDKEISFTAKKHKKKEVSFTADDSVKKIKITCSPNEYEDIKADIIDVLDKYNSVEIK